MFWHMIDGVWSKCWTEESALRVRIDGVAVKLEIVGNVMTPELSLFSHEGGWRSRFTTDRFSRLHEAFG